MSAPTRGNSFPGSGPTISTMRFSITPTVMLGIVCGDGVDVPLTSSVTAASSLRKMR